MRMIRVKQTAVLISLVLAALVLCSGTGFAEGIKERMKARLPVITQLKHNGIVGENNRGYLAFVGSKKSHQDVIASENNDRKAIYTHIANQQKTQLAVVEKNRAVQLTQRAAKGTYIQKPDGAWVKK